MKKYDALYIFVNAPKDEAAEPLTEKVGAEITRLGGVILGSEMLGRKTFARELKKRESGLYVRTRFELDPAKVAELRARYALSEDVFRVQILAVDDRREALVVEQQARRRAKAEAEAAASAAAEPAEA